MAARVVANVHCNCTPIDGLWCTMQDVPYHCNCSQAQKKITKLEEELIKLKRIEPFLISRIKAKQKQVALELEYKKLKAHTHYTSLRVRLCCTSARPGFKP